MIHHLYTGDEIIRILQAELVSDNPGQIGVRDILIDSRRLISAENSLFFALETDRNNGEKYIGELYKKGIKSFVVSRLPKDHGSLQGAHFFIVDNTLEALQKLAAAHRANFRAPVIGITGSNGKTIVKEWLYQLLNADKNIVRSPKSYNSQIGVPLSVWQMNAEHELAVFEAGISKPDEMQKLQAILHPDIGIFTNIGQAHAENFMNTRQKIGEKLALFTKVKVLIYNSDQKDLKEAIISTGILGNIRSFTWGKNNNCDLQIIHTEPEKKTTRITAKYKGEEIQIVIPFADKASVENAAHCWAALLELGYANQTISERMLKLSPIAMRLELKAGVNNCTIINDAYNSDFNSLSIALDFMNQQSRHREKVVVLSDILQSGRNEVDLYGEVASLLEKKGVDLLIGIGPAISRQADKFAIPGYFFESTSKFLAAYPFSNFSNQTILLKGARVFEFEQISRILQQKVHETVLEINLDALTHNLNYFRSKLPANTKVMAMVKAFSYGSGGFEIANVLQFHHAAYLAVAYADEGVELRKAGIKLPIMVMNPEEYAFDTMIKHQLEPEIFSFRALKLLQKAIRRNALPQNKPVKVHIKVDTGMHRLGFVEEEIDELISKIQKNPLIFVQSVFSHLAGSNKPELDGFTREQIARFKKMGEKIAGSFGQKVLLHILNSAGISRFPEACFDMVRLGIGLYGIPTVAADEGKLQSVTVLKSALAQIKQLRKGDSASYNRSFIAPGDMTIGIVSIGYADGLLRSLGNSKTNLWIKNKAVPIVGDICMDMCLVDLEGLDVKEGDEVIVFDENHPVSELAEAAGTIPYEILSRISRRVKRIYFHE
ncbi:MAG: bifunctional UDP-N-acetylmuramoyl-tripeptide:D-alanyl-D-alanine ligase/alanine racemase [Bacteroidales bacterium]|nr:bifunctional UDP-N-acetylmuramoyl-tripeptide:D-alanyl-D-alanine ligase/alanine racemase [Bacteroidales bacterium]